MTVDVRHHCAVIERDRFEALASWCNVHADIVLGALVLAAQVLDEQGEQLLARAVTRAADALRAALAVDLPHLISHGEEVDTVAPLITTSRIPRGD